MWASSDSAELSRPTYYGSVTVTPFSLSSRQGCVHPALVCIFTLNGHWFPFLATRIYCCRSRLTLPANAGASIMVGPIEVPFFYPLDSVSVPG